MRSIDEWYKWNFRFLFSYFQVFAFWKPFCILLICFGLNVGWCLLWCIFWSFSHHQLKIILDEITSTVKTDSNLTTDPGVIRTCSAPPEVDNAEYEPLDSYPEGTEVYYHCKDSYNKLPEVTHLLVCTLSDKNEVLWLGEQIQCKSSTALGTYAAYTQ